MVKAYAALHQAGEVTSDMVAYIEQWSRGWVYWRKLLRQMLLHDVSCSAIVVWWENTLAWGEEENRDHRLNSSDILSASSSLCSQIPMLYSCFSPAFPVILLCGAYLFVHVCLPLCRLVCNMWLPCSHLFAFCSRPSRVCLLSRDLTDSQWLKGPEVLACPDLTSK